MSQKYKKQLTKSASKMLPMANSLALLPPPPGHPTLGISAQGPPPGYTYPDPYPTLYIHSMPPLQPLDIPFISPLWWGLVGSVGDWWGGTSTRLQAGCDGCDGCDARFCTF